MKTMTDTEPLTPALLQARLQAILDENTFIDERAYSEPLRDNVTAELTALLRVVVTAVTPTFNEMQADNAEQMQGWRDCALKINEKAAALLGPGGREAKQRTSA